MELSSATWQVQSNVIPFQRIRLLVFTFDNLCQHDLSLETVKKVFMPVRNYKSLGSCFHEHVFMASSNETCVFSSKRQFSLRYLGQ